MFWTVVRWASLVEALLLIGWALALLQEASRFRAPNLYVRIITASYILLVLTAAIHSWKGFESRDHARTLAGIRFVALTFGLFAMAAMWRYYRYPARVRRHSLRSELAAARLRQEAGLDEQKDD